MKILLAFHQTDWKRCGYYPEKYFYELGHDVFIAGTETTPYWSDWNHRLPFYVPKGLPVSIRSLEEKLRAKFDLVIEFDSSGQYHLTGLRRPGLASALWSVDSHLESKRRFHVRVQRDFERVFVAHKAYLDFFDPAKRHWLPLCSFPELHKKLDLPKVYDVVFIGNADPGIYPERVRLLERLSKRFKVQAFNRKVYREEMVRVFNQAKIVFNRSFNGDLNFRVFETLGSGTCLVTDRAKEGGLEELFKDGQHLVIYDTPEQLEEKVAYYLSHDEERERIAQAGHREVEEKHTFAHRIRAILDQLAGAGR